MKNVKRNNSAFEELRRKKNRSFAIGTLSTLLLGGTLGADFAADHFRPPPHEEMIGEDYRYREILPLGLAKSFPDCIAYHQKQEEFLWTFLSSLVFGGGIGIGYGNMLRYQKKEDEFTRTR